MKLNLVWLFQFSQFNGHTRALFIICQNMNVCFFTSKFYLFFLFIYLACFLSVWFYIWCLDKHFDHIVTLICRYIYIFDIPLVIHSSLARLLFCLFICPFIRLRDCWRDVHAWGNWKSVITIFDGIQIVSSASANNEFCLFFHYVSRALVFLVYFIFFILVRLSIDAILFDKQNCLFTPFAAFLTFSTVKMMIVNSIMDTQKKYTQFKHITYWHT